MNFYPRRRRMPQVIIVSLIDIFAILLIFVIVTTTFKTVQPEVTIKLPESKTAVASDSAGAPPVVLSIAENDDLFLAEKKLTVEELKPAIEELMRRQPMPALALSADRKASYGTVIGVLDALKAAGVKGNLSAFTKPSK